MKISFQVHVLLLFAVLKFPYIKLFKARQMQFSVEERIHHFF